MLKMGRFCITTQPDVEQYSPSNRETDQRTPRNEDSIGLRRNASKNLTTSTSRNEMVSAETELGAPLTGVVSRLTSAIR